MLPRLVRFYGGDPAKWCRMPLDMAQAFMDAMVPIQARESLSMASAVAVGSGQMKKDDARRTVEAWRRQARIEVVAKPKDRGDLKARLRASGIGFKEVKRG